MGAGAGGRRRGGIGGGVPRRRRGGWRDGAVLRGGCGEAGEGLGFHGAKWPIRKGDWEGRRVRSEERRVGKECQP